MDLMRIIRDEVAGDLARREVGIVVGPRQVGKTTLLKDVARHCRKSGVRFRYFDLEMPADADYFARPPQAVLLDMGKERQAVFIDEFHYLPNATKLFKAIYDGYPKVKVYASGSSALEMHRHLRESLAGRRRLYRLFPLSFAEWLPSRSRLAPPKTLLPETGSAAHRQLRRHMEEFILFGGMPGLVHERGEEARKRLLLDLVATYIQKDIKALIREEDILSFNRLLILLAGQEGGLLSENGLSQTLNYSLRQVRKDLAILSQMFLLDILKPFHANRGRELKQVSKIYYFDSGIRNAVLRDFRKLGLRPDQGALKESFVLHELQKNLRVSQEIYYWRTREKDEVDFILVEDRIPTAIEVKSRMATAEVPSGISRFFASYPECRRAVVLNDSLSHKLVHMGREVLFAPHYCASLIPSKLG